MKHSSKIVPALTLVILAAMAAVAFGQESRSVGDPRERVFARRGHGHEKPGGMHRHRGMGRNVVTGEFKVKTRDGFATVRVDHGEVTAVSDGSLTLKRADDETVTIAVGEDARIRKDRRQARLEDIEVGNMARVIRVDDGGDGFVTRRVLARSAGGARRTSMDRDLGFAT